MVREVHGELKRHQAHIPALAWFLSEYSEEWIYDLEPKEKAAVAQSAISMREPDQHEDANIGEIATVALGSRLVSSGFLVCVITDDREGRNLAKARGLDVVGTPRIVERMVETGCLSAQDGARVGREYSGNPDFQRQFHLQLKDLAPSST